MPWRQRAALGGFVYHVLNRAVGRATLFDKPADYAAFVKVLGQAHERTPMRLLSFCVMPNHWHLVLWPRRDGELSAYMHWLTMTHTQRWHAHHGAVGAGPLFQGRFKSFPVVARLADSDSRRLGRLRQWCRNRSGVGGVAAKCRAGDALGCGGLARKSGEKVRTGSDASPARATAKEEAGRVNKAPDPPDPFFFAFCVNFPNFPNKMYGSNVQNRDRHPLGH